MFQIFIFLVPRLESLCTHTESQLDSVLPNCVGWSVLPCKLEEENPSNSRAHTHNTLNACLYTLFLCGDTVGVDYQYETRGLCIKLGLRCTCHTL